MRRTHMAAATLTLGTLAPASAVADHAHMTVDTEDGKIKIVAGYLSGEEAFSIDEDGWVRRDGEIYTIVCDQTWSGGNYDGWPIAVEQMTLTSDYFTATGRLDGGYYWYELTGVTALSGDPTPTLIWAQEHNGTLVRIADSDATTRTKRSFELGFVGHLHEQRQLIEAPGLYEIEIVAWDSNGVYADSDPVRFYIEVPGCDADFTGDGTVNTQDVIAYLNAWTAGDGSADFDGNGEVDTRDFLAFLNVWVAGC